MSPQAEREILLALSEQIKKNFALETATGCIVATLKSMDKNPDLFLLKLKENFLNTEVFLLQNKLADMSKSLDDMQKTIFDAAEACEKFSAESHK